MTFRNEFFTVIYLSSSCFFIRTTAEFCTKDKPCGDPINNVYKTRYLLYDVNHPEGFNLRRDVYMRLAIFVHVLKSRGYNWHLVLPPWHHLYHWKSDDLGAQSLLPWSTFFDIESMQRFSPVIEFHDFLDEAKDTIDKIYYLEHYKNAFSTPNWDWKDRWDFTDCDHLIVCEKNDCPNSYYIYDGITYRGWFWGYGNVNALSVQCVSFQGPASLLKYVLDSNSSLSSLMVDHAEVVVHDTFGDSVYWKCRRSMRFSKDLVKEAREFRTEILGCNDTRDGTVKPKKWENEKPLRKAIGGPYVCAHIRRGDFLFGRGDQVPSIEGAAQQIKKILKSTRLDRVFLASDATFEEIDELEKHLKPATLVYYRPDFITRTKIKDGGVAIVDQIICSYARYFIGTHESTYTFRIQEEREILGFQTSSTFNLFCAAPNKCFEPSKWTIVF